MSEPNDDFRRVVDAAKRRIREIPLEEAEHRVAAGDLLLDVRDREEYEQEHIPGAANLSRGLLELKAHEIIGAKDRPVVVYCGGGYRFKGRASLAADPHGLKSLQWYSFSSPTWPESPAQTEPRPYPQKLWITLWITRPGEVPNPGQIAYLLPWSKNDQPFLPFLLNELQASHSITWSL